MLVYKSIQLHSQQLLNYDWEVPDIFKTLSESDVIEDTHVRIQSVSAHT